MKTINSLLFNKKNLKNYGDFLLMPELQTDRVSEAVK